MGSFGVGCWNRVKVVKRGVEFAKIRDHMTGIWCMSLAGLYISFIGAMPRAFFKGAMGRIWLAGRHLRRPAIHTVFRNYSILFSWSPLVDAHKNSFNFGWLWLYVLHCCIGCIVRSKIYSYNIQNNHSLYLCISISWFFMTLRGLRPDQYIFFLSA